MHAARTTNQKPGDDLLANFRQQFPEVASAPSSSAPPQPGGAAAADGATADGPGQERYVREFTKMGLNAAWEDVFRTEPRPEHPGAPKLQ